MLLVMHAGFKTGPKLHRVYLRIHKEFDVNLRKIYMHVKQHQTNWNNA